MKISICMINSESLSFFSHSHCLLLKQETFVFLQIIKCGSLTGGLIFLSFNSLKVIVKMNGSLLVPPFTVSYNCYINQQKEAEVHLCAQYSKDRMPRMTELKTGPEIKALIFRCRIFLKPYAKSLDLQNKYLENIELHILFTIFY